MFQNIDKNNSLYLLLIIFTGLIFRCYGIDNALLDYASYRQTYTAMFARNFYLHGFDLLNPRLDIYGIKNISEFPLYPALVAIFYKVFGLHEIIGRIISIFFYIPASLHLFRLTKNLFDRKTALYGSLFYSLFPMMIYYNRTFMLESMMIYFSIAALDFLYRWKLYDNKIDFIAGILFLAAAFLLKIPTVYLLLPVACLIYKKYTSNYSRLGFTATILLALIPAFIWYFLIPELMEFQNGIINQKNSILSKVFSRETLFLRIYLYTKWDTWRKLFLSRIFEYQITPIATLLILFWISHKVFLSKNKIQVLEFCQKIFKINPFKIPYQLKVYFLGLQANVVFLLLWIISFLLFMMAFPVFNILHEYYQIPLLGPASILLALIIVDLNQKYQGFKYLNLVLILFFISLSLYSGFKVQNRLKENFMQWRIASKVKTLTLDTDKITILDSLPRPEIFYYSQRKGFIIPVFSHGHELSSISQNDFIIAAQKMFHEYKKSGSKILVIPDSSYPEMAKQLIGNVQSSCMALWKPNDSVNAIQGIYSMDCNLKIQTPE